jgi:hypothetical protein
MHVDEHAGQPDPARIEAPSGRTAPAAGHPQSGRPARRLWADLAWTCGGVALAALVTRISVTGQLNSDGASIVGLQGMDLLHGHLLLHGWITADASYYTLELPLAAIVQSVFGLTSVALHIVSAVTYVIVAALAVALARTGSSGAAAAARCAVVLAVLTAPVITAPGVAILLEAPQHIGTSAYILGVFLLVDRGTGRFTAPLAGLVLAIGQVGDPTVLYVGVPAVVLVCAYRVVAARSIRSRDAAAAIAAAVSVPVAMLVRIMMRHLGAFAMVPPRTALAPPRLWFHHAAVTWQDVRTLFGADVASPATGLHTVAAAFGWACLLAAVLGLAWLAWNWRAASRTEQFAGVAIVVNLGVYVVSTMATTTSTREIAAALPCGAVLAARACVPRRIASPARGEVAALVSAATASLALVAALVQPVSTPAAVPLAAWLRAHRLSYGIAGYWDAAAVTVEAGNQVQVRAIVLADGKFSPFYWETMPDWYTPSQHDATFVIADTPSAYPDNNFTVADTEKYFGQPTAIYQVADREILLYRTNLLKRLAAPVIPSPTGRTD